MRVAARLAGTEPLPRRKTYDQYVRISEPGRHIFKSRLSPGKILMTLFGMAFSGTLVWLGFRTGAFSWGGWIGLVASIIMWAGSLVVTVTWAWNVLHNTIVEITPQRISMKRRRFVGWVERESWDLSSFTEATLQTTVAFGRGTRVPRYWPVLEFDPWYSFTMGEGLYGKPDAEEFIRDVTASVERARLAPETL
jgi:hypothetical protein